jgi:hypothetical protein
MNTRGGHLGLDDVVVVVEKADVVIMADALVVFGVADEDVGGNGGVGERYVGGPHLCVMLNGASPTVSPVIGIGGLCEHIVDEAYAIKVTAAVAVFTPHNLARCGDIVSTDNARSLTEASAVPLCQKGIGVLLRACVEKVSELRVVVSNDGAARLFKAASADVMACHVTLGSTEREVCESERRLVPRHGTWTVAAAVQDAWKGSRRSPQVVRAKHGAGKSGDGFSIAHERHLKPAPQASRRTPNFAELYIALKGRAKKFEPDER